MPSTHQTNARVRRGDALRLRQQGVSYRDIADELHYAGPSGAHKAVETALFEHIEEPAAEMRTLELTRLDAMTHVLAPKVDAGDVKAILATLKLMERRAKLTGLDQPILVDIRQQLIEAAAEFGFTEEEAVQAASEIVARGQR